MFNFPLFSAATDVPDGGEVETGPQRMARAFGTLYLGAVPMDIQLLACGENGRSLIETFPQSAAAGPLLKIVNQLVAYCVERHGDMVQDHLKK